MPFRPTLLQRFGLWLIGGELLVIQAREQAAGYTDGYNAGWQDGARGITVNQQLRNCSIEGAVLKSCWIEDCHVTDSTTHNCRGSGNRIEGCARPTEVTPEPHDACSQDSQAPDTLEPMRPRDTQIAAGICQRLEESGIAVEHKPETPPRSAYHPSLFPSGPWGTP